MPADVVFVLHDPRSASKSRENRHLVASHIGRHHRNRSKPTRSNLHARSTRGRALAPSTFGRFDSGYFLSPAKNAATGNGSNDSGRPSPEKQEENASACRHEGGGKPMTRPSLIHDDAAKSSHNRLVKCHPAQGQPATPGLPRALLNYVQFDCPQRLESSARFGFDFQINYVFPLHSTWGVQIKKHVGFIVQMICRDDGLFNAISASAHGIYDALTRPGARPSAATLWHRSRALSKLQDKLLDPVSATRNETLLGVFYLLESAARFGHQDDFLTHYIGLHRLIQIRGSIVPTSLEDVYIDQSIVILEASEMAWTTKMTLEDPDPVDLTYPVPGIPLDASTANLPVGFWELASEGSISREVLGLLADIPPAEYLEHEMAASQRHLKVIQRAWLLYRSSKRSVERLACLGALSFSLRTVLATNLFPGTPFLQRLATIGTKISRTKALYRELMVWAMVVAGAQTFPVEKEEARRILLQIKQDEKWIQSWEDVESAMKKFFWWESFAPFWRACWEQATT
ncbi:hypothetical protein PV08_06424 [Exophiala spinifera]|uniref:Transcription factor domain-containing protein n=1 Tax=Exophiala spinifera TaxID=91928 RepID=A0A0D2BBI6_9EURO|nr:uncharacterized protein PV08_06424 [Exophiala spinifera]KIW16373.1 hypothetical protein PV08_06424 [Exophiala spinifera]